MGREFLRIAQGILRNPQGILRIPKSVLRGSRELRGFMDVSHSQ
jgi:hypothetical protein